MNDKSKIPFGKHKGERLIDVPASYLLWLETQDFVAEKFPDLYEYIMDNLDGLEQESREEDYEIFTFNRDFQ